MADASDEETLEIAFRRHNERADVGNIMFGCYATNRSLDATLCTPADFVRELIWNPCAVSIAIGMPREYANDACSAFDGYLQMISSRDGRRAVFAKTRATTSLSAVAEVTLSSPEGDVLGHSTVVAVELVLPFCGMTNVVVAALELINFRGDGFEDDLAAVAEQLAQMILRTGVRVIAGRWPSAVVELLSMLRSKGVSICPAAWSPYLSATNEMRIHASMVMLRGPTEDSLIN